MGQPPPRPISRSKLNAIRQHPCDGVPRFEVRGSVMAFKVPYSVAFKEIFETSGGEYQPGPTPDSPPSRVFSQEGIKRITALNRLYVGHALRFSEAQRAAADLLRRTPVEVSDGPAVTAGQESPAPASVAE